jgi:hypothetical protein
MKVKCIDCKHCTMLSYRFIIFGTCDLTRKTEGKFDPITGDYTKTTYESCYEVNPTGDCTSFTLASRWLRFWRAFNTK